MTPLYNNFYNHNSLNSSRDPEKEGIIRRAFEKYLAIPLQEIPLATANRLIQWIEFYSSCLGSNRDTWDAFGALEDAGLYLQELHHPLDNFFSNITEQMSHYKSHKNSGQVVVLTTLSCGAMGYFAPIVAMGHYSPALAIASSLKGQGFHVALIDSADGKPCDPQRIPKINETTRYIRVRKKISALNPSLIISSICHDNENLGLRFDLNVPFIELQTDYAITWHVARTTAPFQSTKERPQFFEMARYAKGVRQLILGDSDGTGEKIRQTIGDKAYFDIIRSYIFPTRAPFIRNQDPAALTQLRKEMGVQPGEQVVIFSAGSIEGRDIRDLIPELNKTELRFSKPLYVVIICGSNTEAQTTLKEYLKNTAWHEQIRFQLEGRIDAEKMARYGQIASLMNSPYHGCMIGKAGGSTISENLVSGLYTLMLPEGGCKEEAENRLFICQKKLGEEVHSFNSIGAQLKKVLDRSHSLPPQMGNWENRFIEILDEALETP